MREPGEDDVELKPALKVWSYEVPTTSRNNGFVVKMPAGARVLRVAKVVGLVKLWVLVNAEMPEEDRFFYVARTNAGLPSPDEFTVTEWPKLKFTGLEYVGSWVEPSEVWHVFEVVK